MKQPCPCHSGQAYADCCQPLHLGKPACHAEQLMRSRYSAYVLKMSDYLNITQYVKIESATTNAGKLSPSDLQGIKWLGLDVLDIQSQDAMHATVTFKARFRRGQTKTLTLHETSHFVFEDGHWYYIVGLIKEDNIHSR